jgi:hypothetical protein
MKQPIFRSQIKALASLDRRARKALIRQHMGRDACLRKYVREQGVGVGLLVFILALLKPNWDPHHSYGLIFHVGIGR